MPMQQSFLSRGGLRSWVLAACVCGAAVAPLGCESDAGPKHQTAAERAATVPAQAEAFDRLGYRLQRRAFANISPGEAMEYFQPMGDLLAAQDSGSVVTVIDDRTGERKWVDQAGSALIKFFEPVRDGKQLIVTSESEVFFFDVDTGAVLDKQKLTDVVTTAPALVGDVLVYGTTGKVVTGHSTLARFRLWGALMDSATETRPVRLEGGNIVGLVSRTGDVAFVDGVSGLAVGRNRMFGGAVGVPAVSEGAMFVASRDHSLWAFAAEGGSQLWRYRTEAPLRYSPKYSEGRVYCDLGREGMSAFESVDGRKLWSNADVHGEVVAIRKSELLVYDGETAVVIDATDGAEIARERLDQVWLLKAERLRDAPLYAVSPNGVISRLTAKP